MCGAACGMGFALTDKGNFGEQCFDQIRILL